MFKKFGLSVFVAATLIWAGSADANPKYSKYVKQSLESLLLMCVEGDDNGCYFYGGTQAKRGNLKEAHDAYLIGAQIAKSRAGYVCMFQLARLYQHGQGVEKDMVQAYRWFMILKNVKSQKDLRRAASAKLKELKGLMTPQQRAIAQALSKKGGAKS